MGSTRSLKKLDDRFSYVLLLESTHVPSFTGSRDASLQVLCVQYIRRKLKMETEHTG